MAQSPSEDRAHLRHLGLLAAAMGACAFGVAAIGVLVVRRVAIRHLKIDRTELRSVEIEDLTVARIRAKEVVVTGSLQLPKPESQRNPA
jgi:hypothetical protein